MLTQATRLPLPSLSDVMGVSSSDDSTIWCSCLHPMACGLDAKFNNNVCERRFKLVHIGSVAVMGGCFGVFPVVTVVVSFDMGLNKEQRSQDNFTRTCRGVCLVPCLCRVLT